MNMPVFLDDSITRIVIGGVILSVLVVAAFYVVATFRDYGDDGGREDSETLANLDELHRRGDISDLEYRRIQSSTRREIVGGTSIDDTDVRSD